MQHWLTAYSEVFVFPSHSVVPWPLTNWWPSLHTACPNNYGYVTPAAVLYYWFYLWSSGVSPSITALLFQCSNCTYFIWVCFVIICIFCLQFVVVETSCVTDTFTCLHHKNCKTRLKMQDRHCCCAIALQKNTAIVVASQKTAIAAVPIRSLLLLYQKRRLLLLYRRRPLLLLCQ